MSHQKAAALLLGVGTAATLVAVPARATTAVPATGQAPAAAAPTGSVTLITGDKVSYRQSGGSVQVTGTTTGEHPRQAAFVRFTQNGHQYVVPNDAWGALTRGQVDRELFDITALVAQELDDRHTDRIRVIVTGKPGAAPKPAVPSTAKTTQTLPRLGMRALSTDKTHAADLWRTLTGENGGSAHGQRVRPAAGTKIWLDGAVNSTLDKSVPLVGAPAAWERGNTGQGVKVAVLDTGISSTHPDLAGKVEASENFSEAADADDHAGHGTHVASTITGSGAASGGRYRGVAPGVRLLNGKVLDDNGRGWDSSILAGMEWAVQQGAKVVNMSLGSGPSDGTDLLSTKINELSTASGTLFVVAAGNEGGTGTVSAPGTADAALTVASTTKQDTLSSFSSRGPRAGDFGLKPEISAPGEDITAARAPGAFPQDPGDAQYVTLSGTSMATPHVAGAAAILAGEHPDWTGAQVKAALTGSAKVLEGIDVFSNGAGRLDVDRATTQTVRALTPAAGFGRLPWPHDPALPATAEVRYANDGDFTVTLQLALSVTTTGGAPAPAGLFSADATLTVPAHSTAGTTIRVTAGPDSTGSYEGRLVATAGQTRLVTPVAAQVAEHTHTVTVKALDRSGTALGGDDTLAALQNDTTGTFYFPTATDDGLGVQAEVPEGTYRLLGIGILPEDLGWSATDFALDGLQVTGDRTLTVDLRKAKPTTVSLDDPASRPEVFSAYVTLRSVVDGTDGRNDLAVNSNFERQFVFSPEDIPGVTYSYSAAWAPPQNRVTTSGADPYEVRYARSFDSAGYQGDVTAQLVDIHEQTDPDQVGDVSGKVVLIAPDDLYTDPADPPTQAQWAALLAGLKAKGARLVVTYDYFEEPVALPALHLIRPEDIQGLRARLADGSTQVHVVGRPASPSLYGLFDAVGSGLPSGQAWHFEKSRLARVNSTYRNPAVGTRHVNDQIMEFTDPATGLSGSVEQSLVQPQTRVEYFTPEVSWTRMMDQGVTKDWSLTAPEMTAPATFHQGQIASTAWGTAPFAPRLPYPLRSSQDGKPVLVAYRQGDRLVTGIPMFNDIDPHHTNLAAQDPEILQHGTTRLFRQGTLVDSSDAPGVADFAVPAETGTYRLVSTASRRSVLSPKVTSEWTFTTGHTDDAVRTPLSMFDLGFVLPLDGHNATPAGTALTGKVTVRSQPGAPATTRVRSARVEVSYDNGRTWQKATTKRAASGTWTVTVPGGGHAGGYADLRASAVDNAGNRVKQTITRAYILR
ncbi:S8 family serine peptidase [Streptomyces sp. PA03-5A]|nr:S8 family serine peptidase [Streptomyces sp. PA03-5A]